MLTNEDIWKIALQQSAYDCNCSPEDFLSAQNVVTISKKSQAIRRLSVNATITSNSADLTLKKQITPQSPQKLLQKPTINLSVQ